MEKSTCPCCGYKIFDEEPGHYIVCPVCFWEDDPYQKVYLNYEVGANSVSLKKGQQNFISLGACDSETKRYTRLPNQNEPKDLDWKEFE